MACIVLCLHIIQLCEVRYICKYPNNCRIQPIKRFIKLQL